ncbi:MAG: SMI1/KNR4 family protein [Candidatus Sericytochromatia bacterium]
MKVKISKPNEKISIEDIRYLENKYKISLHKDYIYFLLETNGGNVDINCYFITKKRALKEINELEIRYFFSLEELDNILKMLKRKPSEDLQPEYLFYSVGLKNNIIPIADHFSGDIYIFMDMSATESKVYYVDTELHDDDLMLIDKSFKKFINSFELWEKPESEFKVYSDLILEGKYDELKNIIEALSEKELKRKIKNLNFAEKVFIEEVKITLLHKGKNTSENNNTTKVDLLKLLLEKGASKENLLIEACVNSEKNNFDIVKFLIQNGYDVNKKDIYGMTPLMLSVIRNKETVKLLLENGADTKAIDSQRKSVFDWFQLDTTKLSEEEKQEVLELLKKYS